LISRPAPKDRLGREAERRACSRMGWNPIHTLSMEANRCAPTSAGAPRAACPLAAGSPDSAPNARCAHTAASRCSGPRGRRDSVCFLRRVDQIKDEIYKKGKIVREKTELTGMSSLHKACQYGRDSNVEKLLEEGADVRVTNHWGSNCLHWTVKGFVHEQSEDSFSERVPKYMAIARLLFSYNRKLLEGQDSLGRTPLDLAKELEATEMIAFLTEKDSQVREQKKEMDKKKEKNKPKVRRVGVD